MASFVFGAIANGERIFLSVLCVGAIFAGSIYLVCFVVGELQKHGRKRATEKKVRLEETLATAKARDEIRKRELRMAKERLALKRMTDGELEERTFLFRLETHPGNETFRMDS